MGDTATMFCFQCEQTAGCTGCTGATGVCGKQASTAVLQDEVTARSLLWREPYVLRG